MEEVVEKFRVHKLRMVAEGGKFRGMRGGLHKIATDSGAYRLQGGPNAVMYGDTEDSPDIVISLYFIEHSEITAFINKAKKCFRIPDFLRKCQPDYKPKIVVTMSQVIVCGSDLVPIFNENFETVSDQGSIDYDRAFQDLGSYTTSETSRKRRSSPRASTPTRSSGRLSALTVLDVDNPIFLFQQLEDPSRYAGDPYRLHLITKRYRLAEDPNNYLAGSWEFHQLLDGLNCKSLGGVPGLVVEFDRVDGERVRAADGVRSKVFVRIRFYNDTFRRQFSLNVLGRLKSGSRGLQEDGTVETFVHVLDVNSFKRSLGVKIVDTQKEWDDLEAR